MNKGHIINRDLGRGEEVSVFPSSRKGVRGKLAQHHGA